MAAIHRFTQRWELWIIILLGVYFIGRLFYFASTVGSGVPPDEITHIGIVRLYAGTLLGIDNSSASFQYGLVTHAPYLYYFVMGKVAAITGDSLSTLRLLNIGLALVLLLFAYRLSLLVIQRPIARLLFFVMLTNTLMFGFLSASVNYDNLANLLAVLAVYFLVRYFRSDDPVYFLSFVICTGLGLLTKSSFLMLTPILGATWLIVRLHTLRGDMQRLLQDVRAKRRCVLVLMAGVVACVIATVSLYGTNLVRYGAIVPVCSQVLTHEQCMENRIYARNWVVGQYAADKMTFLQAWQAAEGINHPTDKRDARGLLQNEQKNKATKPVHLNVLNYMHVAWVQVMQPSIFGILGHQVMRPTFNELTLHGLVFFCALLLWMRYVQFNGSDSIWLGFAVLVMGYYCFLVGYYNYSAYLNSHTIFLGAQGRYLFHVLVPAYLLMAEFMMRPLGNKGQIILLLIVGSIFVVGDFPYYLEHVTHNWTLAIE